MTESISAADEPVNLIVGLGNPGPEYAMHRHNIGFVVVDRLADAHGLVFARRRGTRSLVATGHICGQMVALGKPQTFMNLSGKAVAGLSQLYRTPPHRLMVVYDDLDMPLGRLRLRSEGGAGGHRGLRSIIDWLGTQSFPRLRVGIDRPPGKMDPAEYVLRPFSADEQPLVNETVQAAVAAIECWLTAGILAAMGGFNRPVLSEAPCAESQ